MFPKPHDRVRFFERIAPYYDLLIDLLTFGTYARFLRKSVEVLAPESGERIQTFPVLGSLFQITLARKSDSFIPSQRGR